MTDNMTKNREDCGIKQEEENSKITRVDEDGVSREYTFVKERVIKDKDGFIIGVEKIWQ